MLIPILNINNKVVDENGYLTDTWNLVFTQLFTQMQINLSDDGFVVPSLTSDQITNNANISNPSASPDGTLYYNIDTNKLSIRINGVVKDIITT